MAMRTTIAALLMLGLLLAAGRAPAADCDALAQALRAEAAGGELERLRALYDESLDCGSELVASAGLAVARAWWNDVLARAQASGRPASAFEGELRESLRYGQTWQAQAALGDIEAAREDHAAAARHYQLALDAVAEPALTPREPPQAVIAGLFRKAEVARLLSPVHVAMTRTRSGAPAGVGSAGVRSFAPERVAVPVEFVFAEARFTPKGEQAAAELLEILRAEARPAITLIGHTDPVGSHEANDRLSLARAQAVADFLRRGGYEGRIAVGGRGKREPLAVDDPGRYSREQLHQIYRRVELARE